MNRALRFVLLLLAMLVAQAAFRSVLAECADKEGDDFKPDFAKLERGMRPEQVRQLVGAPMHIARQIVYHHYREQWIYGGPFPVRLTFDCPRGQKPQLLSLPGLPDRVEPHP